MESNKHIITIYKEVGKESIVMKIKNSVDEFRNLLGGEIEEIYYEDIIIICKKEREKLKPNIYLNIRFGKIDTSIRGDLFIITKQNNIYNSLNKEQIIKYTEFLMRESFNYKHFDKNGKYLSNKEFKKGKNSKSNNINNKNYSNKKIDRDTILYSILKCQLIIVDFIKEYMSNN